MRYLLSIIMLATFVAPASASTIERASNCLLEQISAEERTSIGRRLTSQDMPEAEWMRLVEDRGLVCASRLALGVGELESALLGSLAILVLEASGPQLARAGIAPSALEAWFDGLSESARLNYGRRSMTEADLQSLTDSLFEHLSRQGVEAERVRQNGKMLGIYLNAKVLLLRMRQGLPLADRP